MKFLVTAVVGITALAATPVVHRSQSLWAQVATPPPDRPRAEPTPGNPPPPRPEPQPSRPDATTDRPAPPPPPPPKSTGEPELKRRNP